jgi:phosphodiesterase/alkaline phosphatase D-like protein
VERREILEHVSSRGVQDIAFLTGDIHTFFAGEVGTDGRGPESVATEFVGGSISSLGIPERRGYAVVEANAAELRVEFRPVDALKRSTAIEPPARFRVARGTPRVEVL